MKKSEAINKIYDYLIFIDTPHNKGYKVVSSPEKSNRITSGPKDLILSMAASPLEEVLKSSNSESSFRISDRLVLISAELSAIKTFIKNTTFNYICPSLS